MGETGTGMFILLDMAVTISFRVLSVSDYSRQIQHVFRFCSLPLRIKPSHAPSKFDHRLWHGCACVVGQDDDAILWRKWHGRETEAKEIMGGFEIVSKLLLIQGALDSLLRGGGNLYSVQNKPMTKAMAELWRGMIGLDAKKQTVEVNDVLDLVRHNSAEIKTLKEMVTAISSKMNMFVPVSPHVAPGSPSPPPPLPLSICNGGGGNGGNGDY
ncbi:hypothetical protein LOK49_Contig765G00003 [Camellia lanceoleosa]|nr:hypothetical protein LOK49_Contig765G00003 [Camellia lanceoleosa]